MKGTETYELLSDVDKFAYRWLTVPLFKRYLYYCKHLSLASDIEKNVLVSILVEENQRRQFIYDIYACNLSSNKDFVNLHFSSSKHIVNCQVFVGTDKLDNGFYKDAFRKIN